MSSPVIIVTGASRGIGLATVRSALSLGCRVVGAGRSKITSLDAWKDLLQKYPTEASYIEGDLCERSVAQEIVKQTVSKYGKIDGVVLNAGVVEPFAKVKNTDIEEAKRCFDINFFSVWTLIQETLPEMRKSHGKYIIVSSGAAAHAIDAWSAYCSSKAAVNMLGFCLTNEEKDVICVSIRPGVVDTDMQKTIREQGSVAMDGPVHAMFTGLYESGKLVKAEDAGYQLAKLVMECPADLNGQFLDYMDEKLAAFRK
ncbi:hypothetical protein SmJEL517_g02458 [Synchytrium microbalum]|uniref:Sepiapterin reductase n=1 Tax=Synchytrium microbalum TaxID=1806994 RepID=A0A507CAY5_9FUNG|nr:uncharacterized protein SmJEL517_g02458 [Synchytrium microbalum]TPX35114.1 hypothetical protein SmJEL517_g02458 [Synchytrium microbalum]